MARSSKYLIAVLALLASTFVRAADEIGVDVHLSAPETLSDESAQQRQSALTAAETDEILKDTAVGLAHHLLRQALQPDRLQAEPSAEDRMDFDVDVDRDRVLLQMRFSF